MVAAQLQLRCSALCSQVTRRREALRRAAHPQLPPPSRHAAASPRLRLRLRRAAPVAAFGAAALNPDVLFGVANAMVMPVYGLMLWAPRSQLTRRVVRSRALWLALACLYGVLLAQSWRADTLALMFPPAWPPLPRLTAIAAMFERPAAAAAFWVHLLTLDLLVACFVLQDGQRRRRDDRTPVAPALVACMMFGPTGLMLHAATRKLAKMLTNNQARTRATDKDAAAV